MRVNKKPHSRAAAGDTLNRQDLLKDLKRLSALKNNWYSVAVIFEEYKKVIVNEAHTSRRIVEGCEACGYRINTVNRMIAVRNFVDEVKEQFEDLQKIDLNDLSFSNLEMAMRLHRVNPKEGLSILSEIINGRITFRNLRERYNELVSFGISKASVQQLSRRELADLENAALEAIKYSLNELFGSNQKIVVEKARRYELPFNINFAAKDLDKKNKDDLFGFLILYPGTIDKFKFSFEIFISRLFFASNFFNSIWAIIPSTLEEKKINNITNIIRNLKVESIGIAKLNWSIGEKSYLEILHKPIVDFTYEPNNKLDNYRFYYQQIFGDF